MNDVRQAKLCRSDRGRKEGGTALPLHLRDPFAESCVAPPRCARGYLQGQAMLHDEASETWQPLSGVFQLNPEADRLWLEAGQADAADGYLDGTRAVLDDLEIRVFDTFEDASTYVATYHATHPTVFEAGSL